MSENDGGLRVDMTPVPAPEPIPVETVAAPTPTLAPAPATAPTPAADAPPLNPDQVRLSKGQVVRLRELNGLDSDAVERFLAQKNSISSRTYAMALAIYAITDVDGQRQKPIKTAAMLDSYLMEYSLRDLAKIGQAFSRVNGLGEDDDTFPGAR